MMEEMRNEPHFTNPTEKLINLIQCGQNNVEEQLHRLLDRLGPYTNHSDGNDVLAEDTKSHGNSSFVRVLETVVDRLDVHTRMLIELQERLEI
jgi:hypothetical protein